MNSNDRKPDDLKRIDPEDYIEYEESYLKKGSGGGGAPDSSKKGKKTIKAIRAKAKQSGETERRSTAAKILRKELEPLLTADQDSLELYLIWLEKSFSEGIELDSDQLLVSFSKSGGPGGQNVNKRETKVALVHKPSGIRVVNDQTRSQIKNRELALEQLKKRLEKHILDWRNYLGANQAFEISLVMDLLKRG